MAAVDMAPPCVRCRELTGRMVRHWPDTRHYGRVRRVLARWRGRRD
jgi:hypothetical protein